MCGYYYIRVIDFMLKGKSLLDYTNLFSPNDYDKNDEIILKYFQSLKRWKNYIALFEKPKVSYLLIKHSINYGKCKNEDEKLF